MFQMFFSSNVLDRVRGRTRDEIEEVLTEVVSIVVNFNNQLHARAASIYQLNFFYLIWLCFGVFIFTGFMGCLSVDFKYVGSMII